MALNQTGIQRILSSLSSPVLDPSSPETHFRGDHSHFALKSGPKPHGWLSVLRGERLNCSGQTSDNANCTWDCSAKGYATVEGAREHWNEKGRVSQRKGPERENELASPPELIHPPWCSAEGQNLLQ